MRREKKSVLLSLFLACSIFFTSEFGTLAADSQSEAQAIKTINHEVTISPLAETMEQIPEVAEKAAKKALKEKRAKIRAAKRRAARKAAREKAAQEKAAAARYAATKGKKASVSVDERTLLAALIYCEAGNQPHEGKVAVGAVVFNRIRSSKYPNTMREVIYQRGQFGPAITGKLDRILAARAIPKACFQAADDAINGVNPVGDALYFGCGNYGKKIGAHWFH